MDAGGQVGRQAADRGAVGRPLHAARSADSDSGLTS